MNTTTTPPEDKVQEFETILGEIKGGWAEIKSLPSSLKTLKDDTAQLQEQFKDVRRQMAGRVGSSSQVRAPGLVSDECARHFAAQLVAHCQKSDRLSGLCSVPAQRDALISFACDTLNLSTKSALTTTD